MGLVIGMGLVMGMGLIVNVGLAVGGGGCLCDRCYRGHVPFN